MSVNKPLSIADTTLNSTGHKLKQTGKYSVNCFIIISCSSLVFCPIPTLDDWPHWLNFILLLDIVDIVFAPVCTADIAVPKMHYMIHIPEWITR